MKYILGFHKLNLGLAFLYSISLDEMIHAYLCAVTSAYLCD